MGGFKKRAWFSPRAVKEPTSLVVEEKIGPNSVRYTAAKKVESNRLETKPMNMGLSYEDYRKNKETKKEKREKRRNHNANLWAEDAYGDEISYGYGSTFKSSMYEWEPTRWSNFSYASFANVVSDNNEDMFVKEPENYLTPTIAQIKAKTNYWTTNDLKRIKELSRVCYFKMRDITDYLHEDYEDEYNCGLSTDEYRKKKAIFDNVYTTFVPGFTPLEQAIAINHKINDMEALSRRARNSPGRGQVSSTYEFRRSAYADANINNQLELCYINREYSLDILNMVSVMGDLGSQFKVERAVGETEVGYSDMHKPVLMKSYDQIALIEVYQRMLHGYNVKFATKNLIVNSPVQSSEQKQVIIIMLDFSGSMEETHKQINVNAILADRFRYVIKGEAEVYFSYFLSNTEFLRFKHIKNEEDVMQFWKKFSNSPNGGQTDIGRNVNCVYDNITSGDFFGLGDLSKILPEILIINDGRDEVGYKEFPYKVNAISLSIMSDELKGLCIASGGKQVFIETSKRITSYSKNGMEVVSE